MALKTITGKNELESTKRIAELEAAVIELQAKVTALATLANELKADYNGTLAKLDADAGVTDTNYAATKATAAPDVTI